MTTWKRKPSKYDWREPLANLSLPELFRILPGGTPGNNSFKTQGLPSLPGTQKKRDVRKRAKQSRRLNRGK